MWPAPVTAQEKLYGDVHQLQLTTDYIISIQHKSASENDQRTGLYKSTSDSDQRTDVYSQHLRMITEQKYTSQHLRMMKEEKVACNFYA